MKNRQILRRWRSFFVDQDGAIAIVIALLLPVLFGFAGLSIDIGHLYVVKTQLKNAADAGALAGARGLVPYTATKQPDWVNGTQKAQDAVKQNSADGKFLAISRANPGAAPPTLGGTTLISIATPCYWNLNTKTITSTAVTPGLYDVPAMHVVVSKTDGQNDGKVPMFLASVLDVLPADVSATSVAMISFPRGMKAGALFPMAVIPAIGDLYYAKTTTTSFNIGYDSTNGQLTSFTNSNCDTDTFTNLIANGNPTALTVNTDKIYIFTGASAASYGNAASRVGTTVIIPVADILSQNPAEITGFVAFYIEAESQSQKYIRGHFDNTFQITAAAQIGSPVDSSSSPTPPQLVN